MGDERRLDDLRGRTLVVECPPCGKNRVYGTAALCRKLGAQTALTDALLVITQGCRYQRRVGSTPRNEYGTPCRARLILDATDRDRGGRPDEGFTQPLLYPPFRIDSWGPSGSLRRELALLSDLRLAHASLDAAGRLYPEEELTLRQRARVLVRAGRGQKGP